jgi:uncharacterized protein (TIGR02996 family)
MSRETQGHNDAFLQAISEDPDNDSLRLIYADWLEELGQIARADFIRVQCQLAGLPEGDPRRQELEAREQTLLKEHGREWAGPLMDRVKGCQFRRGFVDTVKGDRDALLAHAGELFRAQPLRCVCFLPPRLPYHPARHFSAPPGGPLYQRLAAACPRLVRISVADFYGNCLGDRGVKALADSPVPFRLCWLGLGFTEVGDVGARALAESSSFPHLRTLKLNQNRELGPRAVEALSRSPFLTGLRALDLSYSPIGDAGIEAIAQSPNLLRLTNLNLAFSGLGSRGAQALIDSPYLTNLESLRVDHEDIGRRARYALRERFGDRVHF